MDSRGVVYFSLNTKHLLRLCVSLNSLRKHYNGNVAILNGGGDNGVCDRIGRALGADVLSIPIKQRRRNTAYCTKPTLYRFAPYQSVLLIDADTTIAGDITPLLDLAEKGLVVTRFSTWVTVGKLISGRILKWRGVKCDGIDVERLIDKSLEAPLAAINTGAICWDKTYSLDFLRDWERLTNAGAHCPFTDELSCQILIRQHQHTLVDCRYNFSPIHAQANGFKPVIYHNHGSKHLRPEAQPHWMPEFKAVWDANIAGIHDWADDSETQAVLAAIGNQ